MKRYRRLIRANDSQDVMTVPKLVEAYLTTRTYEPLLERATNRHFDKWFSSTAVTDINEDTIQTYIDMYTGEGNRESSAARWLNVLRAALNWGMRTKRIPKGEYAWRVKAKARIRERALTRNEAAKLLWVMKKSRTRRISWIEVWAWIAISTGARPSAVRMLRWEQVDLERGQIDFRDGRETSKKRGIVPISRALMPVLRLAHRHKTGVFVVGKSANGMPPTQSHLYAVFTEMSRRAGFVGEGLNAVSPYTMRHTAASLMLRGGAGAWATAGVLKISLQRLTSVYAKHFDDHLREAVNKL